MNRHPFRWDAMVFGLFFLAVLGQWAVWEQDLLDPDTLGFITAAALITLGLAGIAATVISARTRHRVAPFSPTPDRTADPDDSTPEGNPE